eukprot:3167998-Amphidinium_carterae.1
MGAGSGALPHDRGQVPRSHRKDFKLCQLLVQLRPLAKSAPYSCDCLKVLVCLTAQRALRAQEFFA